MQLKLYEKRVQIQRTRKYLASSLPPGSEVCPPLPYPYPLYDPYTGKWTGNAASRSKEAARARQEEQA